jgi:Hint domain
MQPPAIPFAADLAGGPFMTVYTVARATVEDGVITGIEQVTISTEGEDAVLMIPNEDNDPDTLTPGEWDDAVGGGQGLTSGSQVYLWDNNPPAQYDGFLYFSIYNEDVGVGSTVEDLVDGLDNNFPPISIPDFVLCFARGTLIRTPNGDVPVEDLSAGDLVLNSENEPVPIRWIGQRLIRLRFADHLRPVRIAANALGESLPSRDLLVSPLHRVLLDTGTASVLFGSDEILVAACELLNDRTITVDRDLQEVEYFHLLFDRHEIILSENLPTESLYPDHAALGHLGEASRQEVLEIFPELGNFGVNIFGNHARAVLKRTEADLLNQLISRL